MKKRLFMSLLIVMAFSMKFQYAHAQESTEAIEENAEDTIQTASNGMPCPEFSLKDWRGKTWHLSDFKGRVLVIDFWATWCGVCIANLPSYAALAAKYKDDDRIQFITISIDSKGSLKHWMYSLPRYNLMDLVDLICPDTDSDFSQIFQVRGVPRYVVINANGIIYNAKAPSPHDGLEDVIKPLLK